MRSRSRWKQVRRSSCGSSCSRPLLAEASVAVGDSVSRSISSERSRGTATRRYYRRAPTHLIRGPEYDRRFDVGSVATPSPLGEARMRDVRTSVLVAIAALQVLAAACGGDANDGGATGSGPTASGGTDSGSGDDPPREAGTG